MKPKKQYIIDPFAKTNKLRPFYDADQMDAYLEEREKEIRVERKMFEELTPQGSEFYNDPKRVFDYIKDQLNLGHQARKDIVKLRRKNKKEIERLRGCLNRCLLWHQGDKWRNSEDKTELKSWDIHRKDIEQALETGEER